MDRDKKQPKPGVTSADSETNHPRGSERKVEVEALFRKLEPDKLQSEMKRPRPGQDAMAAALEAVQRLTAESDAEEAAAIVVAGESSGRQCNTCGHRNREGNKFCSMCGLPVESAPLESLPENFVAEESVPQDLSQDLPQELPPEMLALLRRPPMREEENSRGEARGVPGHLSGSETHHVHHHHHHHYFPAGYEASAPSRGPENTREPERMRGPSMVKGESMNRAETTIRRVTQDWVMACNTKHLDDLLELYSADALVLRSNHPMVRGAAAVREFFFGALNSGLGEVELEPIRVEILGDVAYEAGRCKALVPGAVGKRREERGKYLWVLTRLPNGEWKLASDCWSSDLTLGVGETEFASVVLKPGLPRKGA